MHTMLIKKRAVKRSSIKRAERRQVWTRLKGVFTLTEAETDTKTETDKITTIPNDIGVWVQYGHF